MSALPQKKAESGLFKEVRTDINRLIDYVRGITPCQSSSQGVSIDLKSNGVGFRVLPQARRTGNARVVRMRVTAVGIDSLTCTNLEDGQSLTVAKPFNLRSDNWEAASITYTLEPYPNAPATLTVVYDMLTATYRTATIGGYVEHQVIRPHYKVGFSEIFAAACDDTGLAGVEWVDINADARAWSMVTS